MLGGHPSDTSNDWMIEKAVEDVEKNHCLGGGKAYLIQPQRRDYMREPGDMKEIIESRTRKVEWLPLVRCVGVFSSFRPARDQSKDVSYLTILWFQDAFAMPIAQDVLNQIKATNWNELATDLDNN